MRYLFANTNRSLNVFVAKYAWLSAKWRPTKAICSTIIAQVISVIPFYPYFAYANDEYKRFNADRLEDKYRRISWEKCSPRRRNSRSYKQGNDERKETVLINLKKSSQAQRWTTFS